MAENQFKEAWDNGVELGRARNRRKQDIALRLKNLRKEAKLTQAEASDKITTNRITFAGYESGRYEQSVEVLVRLADLYNVSMDYITCRTDERSSSTESNPEFEERLSKLEEMVSKLSEE